MLSLTKTWQCDIWHHAVRLRLGNCVVSTRERTPEETLNTTLGALLGHRPSALSWRDTVEFHLDTDDLAFLIQPWPSGISTPQELRQLAQLQTARHFCPPVTWRVNFESLAWQRSSLVACLKESCWQMLTELAHRQRLRFRGVVTPFQPLLRYSGNNLPENALFVSVSPHHCRIASRQHHQWCNVWTVNLPRQEISARLNIIARLTGMSHTPRYVFDTLERQSWVESSQGNTA